MNTFDKILRYGMLVAMLLLMITAAVRAQSTGQSTGGPREIKSASAQSYTLTKEELATRDSILSQARPLQTDLQKLIDEFLTTEDEARLPVIWLKSKRLQDKLQPLNTQFTQWLEAIRKAHNCPACALDNDHLVPPTPATSGKP